MFVANLIFMAIWSHTSEVGAKRLRESYLASILRQDVAFFDTVGPGEIATRIETDTREHLYSLTSPSCIFLPHISRSCPSRYFREGPGWN